MPPSTSRKKLALLRGSLIVLKRKCGKPSCHCASGDLHETPALSYSLKGTTTILTLRPSDLPEVKTALAAYRRALASLDRQALAGIAALRARIRSEKRVRR
jgi:hypothetical protein